MVRLFYGKPQCVLPKYRSIYGAIRLQSTIPKQAIQTTCNHVNGLIAVYKWQYLETNVVADVNASKILNINYL